MLNYSEFRSLLPTDKECIAFYIHFNFHSGLKCSKCGDFAIRPRSDYFKVLQCKSCKSQCSIFSDTIFEKTSTDLNKWFYAIYRYYNNKKKISATILKNEIGVTYKTAWRIVEKVRSVRSDKNITIEFLRAVVNISSRYVAESLKSL